MTQVVPEGVQLDQITREMWYIMMRRQKLLSRQIVLLEMQKFLKNRNLTEGAEGAEEEKEEENEPSELEKIEDELKSLSQKEKELVNRSSWVEQAIIMGTTYDSSATADNDSVTSENKKDPISLGVCILPSTTARQSLVTEQPASVDKELTSIEPDPEISEEVVEVKDLFRSAALVHCPTCGQRVTTEIHYKVGKSSFLLCCFSITFCCVAGCCLLPFFLDYFKDIIHRCPSCHTEIHTVHRL